MVLAVPRTIIQAEGIGCWRDTARANQKGHRSARPHLARPRSNLNLCGLKKIGGLPQTRTLPAGTDWGLWRLLAPRFSARENKQRRAKKKNHGNGGITIRFQSGSMGDTWKRPGGNICFHARPKILKDRRNQRSSKTDAQPQIILDAQSKILNDRCFLSPIFAVKLRDCSG